MLQNLILVAQGLFHGFGILFQYGKIGGDVEETPLSSILHLVHAVAQREQGLSRSGRQIQSIDPTVVGFGAGQYGIGNGRPTARDTIFRRTVGGVGGEDARLEILY